MRTLKQEVGPIHGSQAFNEVTKAYLCRFYSILDEMIAKMTKAQPTDSLSHTFIVQNKSLSEDEIAKRLEDMQKLKLSPGDEPVNRLLMETAKRLFMQLMGPVRERLVTEMALFGEAIESKNISDVRKAQERFQRVLNQLDQFDDGLQE